ncbi:MAG: hypothetical protein ACK559_29940 [bacterium]
MPTTPLELLLSVFSFSTGLRNPPSPASLFLASAAPLAGRYLSAAAAVLNCRVESLLAGRFTPFEIPICCFCLDCSRSLGFL